MVNKCIVFFSLSIPAPTPPWMFRLTSVMTTSLSFSWQTPMITNGVLTGYQLSCQPLLSGIPLPQTLTPGPTAVMDTLSNLYPGVGYNCSIVARNSAGPSAPVYTSGTTLETGTSVYVVHVRIRNLVLLCYYINKNRRTINMQKDVGMTCQKVCKQGRDDAKVKVTHEALSLHLFTLQLCSPQMQHT